MLQGGLTVIDRSVPLAKKVKLKVSKSAFHKQMGAVTMIISTAIESNRFQTSVKLVKWPFKATTAEEQPLLYAKLPLAKH